MSMANTPEGHIVDQERLRAEIRQADRQIKQGHYIEHDDMKAWLLSWGTHKELPPPKCECGKQHDEPPYQRTSPAC
jgi:uncharacterized protein (DUF305 family)